jgi:hypothetical protein
MQLHHTGSQEELPVAVQEEQTGSNPQEAQTQEVPEVDEQEEDLPVCGPLTLFLRTRQAPEHFKSPTLKK